MGVALTAGNLWITLARSTIPFSLNHRIIDREVRYEKHPGQDDVCFLSYDDGRQVHVDEAVFRATQLGDHLAKSAWETDLQIRSVNGSQNQITLQPSADFWGMLWVMSAVVLVLTLLAIVAQRAATNNRHAIQH